VLAAEPLDPRLVDALDNDAADHGPWNGSVAKPPQHDGLHLRGRRVEDAVSDVVKRENSPDLSAIGTPRDIVQSNGFATAGLGRRGGNTEERSRSGRGDEVSVTHNSDASRHCLSHGGV